MQKTCLNSNSHTELGKSDQGFSFIASVFQFGHIQIIIKTFLESAITMMAGLIFKLVLRL